MMANKKVNKEILPTEGSSKKSFSLQANKKNLFVLKFTVIALVALNIIILSAVFWNRYLEPKFGFDFVSSGQPVAEAMSLAPMVKDEPPATFQGTPEKVENSTLPEASHDSLLKEIVNALQGQVSSPAESETTQILQRIEKLEGSLQDMKAMQIFGFVKMGHLTLADLRLFLDNYNAPEVTELKKLLSTYTSNHLLSYKALEAEIQSTKLVEVKETLPEKNLFSRLKAWLKGLVVIQKEGALDSEDHSREFVKAIQSHDPARALEVYQKLSDNYKEKLKMVYEQLLLRNAIDKAQSQLILKNISQG